jgi:hypothetical protein
MSEEDFGQEGSTLGGRVRRFAQVGGQVGGLAAQVAFARLLGIGLDRGRHSEDLRSALGGLKGPLMKAAQILATIPDALPREYAEALRQLQSNAPAMGWHFVKRRGRRVPGPGTSGHRKGWPRTGVQAAVSRHAVGRGGRPAAAQTRLCRLPPLRQGDRSVQRLS